MESQIVTDWIISANEDLKYRRCGDIMEAVAIRCFYEKPEIYPIEFTMPKGYSGHEVKEPQISLSHHAQTFFLDNIIPPHWLLSTTRFFKIDGWSRKVIMSEDVRKINE